MIERNDGESMKLLFVIINMEIGGTRSSLINLLTLLSREKDVELNLLVMSHHGDLMKSIPQGVNVLPKEPLLERLFPGEQLHRAWDQIVHGYYHVLRRVRSYEKVYGCVYERIAHRISDHYGVFDAVIGYQEGLSNDLAASIAAHRHISWIHSDIDKWFDNCFMSRTYESSDHILFVAEATQKKFLDRMPLLVSKCRVIKNTIIPDLILENSKAESLFVRKSPHTKLLVSVGRIVAEKAYERVVMASRHLADKEIDFQWVIIGDGYQKDEIEKQIQENGLEQHVHLLGAMKNPYPVMKQADLMVVVSINESQPMVILESLVVGVPVLSTRFNSAEEILGQKPYGIICENSPEAVTASIENILTTEGLLQSLGAHVNQFRYDNKEIINSLLELAR